ncbi:DUF1810 domain-containing protein [Iodidimonas sp. SYSU 1G8]|uniref:DUF1810 domain-containing protein n=1 Tax=Iodidimonas sp. SYSU 1G8 TaxID=3133967 RepID=UPI0031FE7510
MTSDDLSLFIAAQSPVWNQVTSELAAGRKQSHWMWFVFPQIEGLGHSAMARRYALGNLDHARRYLADPALGERLREATRLVLRHAGAPIRHILGTPDDLKFRSSMTLFEQAATEQQDRDLFGKALAAFHAGEPDPKTLELLRQR